MTSQGQRFRRRALRRGYKVDEVDSFLDRVEVTLAGDPIDKPVTAQEVHDVVFRVRFGGYDEWQVDLHLDRVERQLSELESSFGPEPRMGPPPGPGTGQMPPPMSPRPAPTGGPPMPPAPQPEPTFGGSYDETYGGGGYERTEAGRHGRFDMTTEMRPVGPPMRPPPRPDQSMGDQTIEHVLPDHGTAEHGMPGYTGPGRGTPPGRPGAGPPSGMPPSSMPPPAPAPMGPGPVTGGPEVQRIDQLRRTFQPRRFGSGYDRAQVDRLFEEIINGMAGHGPLPVTEAQLDPQRFDLVPGGYFEAEVESALQEVKEILRRR